MSRLALLAWRSLRAQATSATSHDPPALPFGYAVTRLRGYAVALFAVSVGKKTCWSRCVKHILFRLVVSFF